MAFIGDSPTVALAVMFGIEDLITPVTRDEMPVGAVLPMLPAHFHHGARSASHFVLLEGMVGRDTECDL